MTHEEKVTRREALKAKCQAFDDAWEYWITHCTDDGSPAMHFLKELLYAIIDGECDTDKIFIVHETYDNGESYEDHEQYESIAAIFTTEKKAKEYIANLKANATYGNYEPWIEGNPYQSSVIKCERAFYRGLRHNYEQLWDTIEERSVNKHDT